jgi:hypothetical protein
MPYQPYDTGWIKSIYRGICLSWFLHSRGLLPHVASVICYNNTCIPLIELLNMFYELIGNAIIAFGSGIIRCESFIFNRFDYINPIFTCIQRMGSIASNISINSDPPSLRYYRSNIRRRKCSTGKHLSVFYARKRRHRRQYVISGSNISKNDNPIEQTPPNEPSCSHPMKTCNNKFYPIDDPSCQNTTWYDAMSPYWTGGMVWDGAYFLNHQVVSVTTDPIFVSNLPPALELSATNSNTGSKE